MTYCKLCDEKCADREFIALTASILCLSNMMCQTYKHILRLVEASGHLENQRIRIWNEGGCISGYIPHHLDKPITLHRLAQPYCCTIGESGVSSYPLAPFRCTWRPGQETHAASS